MSAWIIGAKRSIVAPWGGALAALDIHQLAAPVIGAALDDAGIAKDRVDELILGNSLGAGGNPARVAALAAGLPISVGGLSVDRQCCSGLDAILLGARMIEAGAAKIVVAGGAESYSRRPYRAWKGTDGSLTPYDSPPFTPWPDEELGLDQAADRLAQEQGIDRAVQDAWAIRSHRKAREFVQEQALEIVEFAMIPEAADTFTRNLTEQLASRAPVLSGSVTNANTAVAADGAAFCILASEDIARRHTGHKTRVLTGATLGADPNVPGLAPVAAALRALDRAGLSADDLAMAEIMEAYAAQAIACVRGLALSEVIANPTGGALARGHPIGASGSILAVKLFHGLARQPGAGLAAIAAAGGLGTALIVEAA